MTEAKKRVSPMKRKKSSKKSKGKRSRKKAVAQRALAVLHHCVYVVELDDRVLEDDGFRAENPDRDRSKPCLYVGSTGLTPGERFQKHKSGERAGRGFVQRHGERLLPELYERYNPMRWDAAVLVEAALARQLREEGYAVWSR